MNCNDRSPYGQGTACTREKYHTGMHKGPSGPPSAVWPNKNCPRCGKQRPLESNLGFCHCDEEESCENGENRAS